MTCKNAYFVQYRKIFCRSTCTSSVYFFGHNGLYLLHLTFGGCGLPKIVGDLKYSSNFSKVAYCWQTSNLDFTGITAHSLSDAAGNIIEIKQLHEWYFLRILSNSAKFSAGRPYFQRIIFRPQWRLPIALIVWGLCPPLNFLTIENVSNYGTVVCFRL